MTAGIVVTAVSLGSHGPGGRVAQGVSQGTTLSLTPRAAIGSAQLARSAAIIQARLRGVGVRGAQVTVNGSALRAVVPAGSLSAVVAATRSRGVLRFRQALELSNPVISGSTGDAVAASGPAESATLSKAFLALYAKWDCATSPNPTRGEDIASDYIVGCASDGSEKYLLAPATIDGSELSGANAGLDPHSQNVWIVNVGFKAKAAAAWQQLTAKAYRVNHGQEQTTSCSPPTGCDAVAIVMDGVVDSAPYISTQGGIVGGQAEISGGFTQRSADWLADILKNGALSTTFAVHGIGHPSPAAS